MMRRIDICLLIALFSFRLPAQEKTPHDGLIRGTIVDSESGFGVADVYIELFDAVYEMRTSHGAQLERTLRGGETRSDAKGKFVFANLKRGDYRLFAVKSGYGSADTRVIRVTGGDRPVDIRLTLPHSGAVPRKLVNLVAKGKPASLRAQLDITQEAHDEFRRQGRFPILILVPFPLILNDGYPERVYISFGPKIFAEHHWLRLGEYLVAATTKRLPKQGLEDNSLEQSENILAELAKGQRITLKEGETLTVKVPLNARP